MEDPIKQLAEDVFEKLVEDPYEQLVEDSAVDPKEELFWVPIVGLQGNPVVELV